MSTGTAGAALLLGVAQVATTAAAMQPDLAESPARSFPSPDVRPLPPAPPVAAGRELTPGPWRGRGWFQVYGGVVVPLAGERPGVGTEVRPAGGLRAGWRPLSWAAFGGGISTFIHDRAESVGVDPASGASVEEVDEGRLTLLDAGFARFFIPGQTRVEPYFDVGAQLGSYRAPFEDARQLVGGARLGTGLEAWLAPTLSIDLGADARWTVVEGRSGLSLQMIVGAIVHW